VAESTAENRALFPLVLKQPFGQTFEIRAPRRIFRTHVEPLEQPIEFGEQVGMLGRQSLDIRCDGWAASHRFLEAASGVLFIEVTPQLFAELK